jgi:uncharacterized protein (DUF2336 family)
MLCQHESELLWVQAEATEASTSKLRQRIKAAQEEGQRVREEVVSLHRHVLACDAENRFLQDVMTRLRQRMLVSAAVSSAQCSCLTSLT